MYTSGNCSGSGSGDGSSLCVLIQSQKGACSSQPVDSPFLSAPSSSPFLGILFTLLLFSLLVCVYFCFWAWFLGLLHCLHFLLCRSSDMIISLLEKLDYGNNYSTMLAYFFFLIMNNAILLVLYQFRTKLCLFRWKFIFSMIFFV